MIKIFHRVQVGTLLSEQWIPWAKPDIGEKERRFVCRALASTWISGGPFVEKLERTFKEHCGVRFALAVSSGTAALHVAYRALGLGHGDEVIVPGFAFMAAANIALQLGAKPVFVDIDPKTWCITADTVRKHITRRTKVIVPVHTYGNVCDMDEILTLARDHNVAVVEDAAEAFCSRYKGHQAGTMGTIGCFSLHATKLVTTGEGGIVVTEKKQLSTKMNLFRNHGMMRKKYYWHELDGHNFRLTNLQAALGCAQMERLERFIRERRRIYRQYVVHLSDVAGLTLQYFAPEVDPVVWGLAVKLGSREFPQDRDAVMDQMRKKNIETRPGFYAASVMKHIFDSPRIPICEETSRQMISLPMYTSLRNKQVKYICDCLKRLCV